MKPVKAWRCYVHGGELGDTYLLTSYSATTDRVFLCCLKCAGQLETCIVRAEIHEVPKRRKVKFVEGCEDCEREVKRKSAGRKK